MATTITGLAGDTTNSGIFEIVGGGTLNWSASTTDASSNSYPFNQYYVGPGTTVIFSGSESTDFLSVDGAITNYGDLIVNFMMTVNGYVDNYGTISAGYYLIVNGSVDNYGSINTGYDLTVNGSLNNYEDLYAGGIICTGRDLNVNGYFYNDYQKVFIGGNLNVNGYLVNDIDGYITVSGDMHINGLGQIGDVMNNGCITAISNLVIDGGLLFNTSFLGVTGFATVSDCGYINNTYSGTLFVYDGVSLDSHASLSDVGAIVSNMTFTMYNGSNLFLDNMYGEIDGLYASVTGDSSTCITITCADATTCNNIDMSNFQGTLYLD